MLCFAGACYGNIGLGIIAAAIGIVILVSVTKAIGNLRASVKKSDVHAPGPSGCNLQSIGIGPSQLEGL